MDNRIIAKFVIWATAIFALCLLFIFFLKTTDIDYKKAIDSDIIADYGTIIGGVTSAALSIASILLLIQTINDQQNNFKTEQTSQKTQFESEQHKQLVYFQKQQVESRFFELLKMLRENSRDVVIKDRSGIKVFKTLIRELYRSLDIVRIANDVRKIPLQEGDIINIAYLSFFFGAVGTNSESILNRNLKRYSDINHPNFTSDLLKLFSQAQGRIQSEESFDYLPFEGHQSRLSRYFRNIFQIIKYIDEQPQDLLSYREKYDYMKTLRVQLSTQEQVLIFFNSLSDLGSPWERDTNEENCKFITKYNIIKNIPPGFTYGINIKKYYPNVNYEDETKKSDIRIKLENSYV